MNLSKNDTNKSDQVIYGSAEELQVVSFEDLAQGAKEVVIEYENQHYRLRVTKNGKLILNK